MYIASLSRVSGIKGDALADAHEGPPINVFPQKLIDLLLDLSDLSLRIRDDRLHIDEPETTNQFRLGMIAAAY